MLKIRLQRVGRKNDPSFRVVCTDSKKGPKSGNSVETLGSYDPKRDYIAVKGDRVEHWILQGAQISDTVNNLLVKEGTIKAKKKHVSRGKKNTRTPEVEEAEVKDLPAEASAKEGEAPAEEGEAPAEPVAEEPKAEEAPTEEAPKQEEAPVPAEEAVPVEEEKVVN